MLRSGAASLTVALDVAHRNDAATERLVALLQAAADQGKIVLRGVGLVGGVMTALTFNPESERFADDDGNTLTTDQLEAALVIGDALLLYGAPLPGAGATGAPQLRALERDTSPVLCYEGYAEYQATARVGEFAVALTLTLLRLSQATSPPK